MAENISQVVIDLESIPYRPVRLMGESDVLATDSSDFSKASGKRLVTKRAAKEYIDKYIQIDNQKLPNFAYTSSNIISGYSEYDKDYPVSHKPYFLSYNGDDIVIMLTNSGINIEQQGIYQTLVGNNIIINKDLLNSVVANFSPEYDGITIQDSCCDGSEDSKFINSLSFSEPTNGILNANNSYRYFRTAKGEIIYGYIDVLQSTLSDINRGAFISTDFTSIELDTLNSGEFLHLMNAVHIFYNVINEEIILIPVANTFHTMKYPDNPSVNDCYFDTKEKLWNVCTLNGVWDQLFDTIYFGDLIYDGTELVAIYNSDIQWIIDNISNIDLRIKNNLAYTYSDKTYITVFDQLVEFEVDRIFWDLSDKTGIQYLYIDGDGKPWVDSLKPKWFNDVQYYGHYYHYWRCVGSVELIEDTWVIKEKF